VNRSLSAFRYAVQTAVLRRAAASDRTFPDRRKRWCTGLQSRNHGPDLRAAGIKGTWCSE